MTDRILVGIALLCIVVCFIALIMFIGQHDYPEQLMNLGVPVMSSSIPDLRP